MIWREPKPPLSPAQLQIEELITRAYALPVGWSLSLEPRADDGFGGMVVTRHSKYSFCFQRSGYQGRSRWADNADQAREEFQVYVETGKLHEPDNVKGW